MSKVHVLQSWGGDDFGTVAHAPMPVGTNEAGMEWKDVFLAAGLNKTILTEGTGPGQTTAAELDQIQNGEILEFQFGYQDDPNFSEQDRLTALNAAADQCISDNIFGYQNQLRLYGLTV